MSIINRPKKYDEDLERIHELWQSLHPWQRKVIKWRVQWSAFNAKCQLPTHHWPLLFALRAAMVMFALLAILPQVPLSMPTAAGGGLAFALLTQ